MTDEPIYCYCPEGGGLMHIHRNPPYDTEGRLELIRRKQEQHVFKATLLPTFENDGPEPDLPMSPNELERLRNGPSRPDFCAIHMNHGDCENPECRNETENARQATVLVGRHYLCDTCADERDRGKSPLLVEPRIKLEDLKKPEAKRCDSQCGRAASMKFHKFNFCDLCAEEILGSNGPFPRQRFEDAITQHNCYQCGERAGVIRHRNQWYCDACFRMLPDWEIEDGEEL